ncbi:MAG: CapA family protein [Clostridia bacterium]|nr:CapA family protein [Clostridia bacterium]
MRRMFVFFLILVLLTACLPACAATEPAEIFEAPKQVVVTFVGDCTLGNTPIERLRKTSSFEYYIEEYGMEYPFDNVLNILLRDDLTVANLEGVFYNHEANKANKTYNFRSSVDHAQILNLASIEAVSIANNHILDYGVKGQSTTIEALETQGIAWFGTNEYANGTYIFEKDGIKIGFVAMYASYMNSTDRLDKMKANVKKMRADGCQVIVACMHGGVEYDPLHDRNQEILADRLIGYGADIIIGHHPHVIQGMRVATGRTTLWSLGNFVFGGNSQLRTMDTFLAQFTFSFDESNTYLGHQLNIIPAHVSGVSDHNNYQPVLVTGKDAQSVLAAIQKDSRPLRLRPYVDGVGAVQEFVPAAK